MFAADTLLPAKDTPGEAGRVREHGFTGGAIRLSCNGEALLSRCGAAAEIDPVNRFQAQKATAVALQSLAFALHIARQPAFMGIPEGVERNPRMTILLTQHQLGHISIDHTTNHSTHARFCRRCKDGVRIVFTGPDNRPRRVLPRLPLGRSASR